MASPQPVAKSIAARKLHQGGVSAELAIASIICVYRKDDPTSLRAALLSIINQEVCDFHHNVYVHIDGPISKELESVIDECADDIFLTIHSQQTIGLAAGLNILLDRLNGEKYVFRMDADDVSMPRRYICQIEFLENNPKISILGTAYWERRPGRPDRFIAMPLGPMACWKALSYRSPIAHPTACFRGTLFVEGLRYPTGNLNEDLGMWIKCSLAGIKMDNLPSPHLKFSIGTTFWQRRGRIKAVEEFKLYLSFQRASKAPVILAVLPALRLLMRIMPTDLSKLAYAIRASLWR